MKLTKEQNRAFYRTVLTLSIPLAIQNLIDACVNTADTLMLGQFVGATELSATSLANNVQFVVTLFMFGLASGASILIAQYWGKKDIHTIERVMGISMRFALPVGLVFTLATLIFPVPVMKIFSSDPAIIDIGKNYLRIISVGYVATAFTSIYVSCVRAMERVKFGTIINCVCLCMNIVLNACFIFGLAFFPKWGLNGVALATTISRVTALVICLVDNAVNKSARVRVKHLFDKTGALMRDFIKYTAPAMGNDVAWGVGFTMYSVIMGHMGTAVVEANTYAGTARQICTIICFALANAAGIFMGKTLGQNKLELAREYGAKFMRLSIITGVVGAVLLAVCIPFIESVLEISAEAQEFFTFMLIMSAFSVFGQSYNTMAVCGIFRAGGDARFGFIMDVSVMWGYGVLLGSLAAFVFGFPVKIVYLILFLDEYVKIPFVTIHYFKRRWVNNITRDFT